MIRETVARLRQFLWEGRIFTNESVSKPGQRWRDQERREIVSLRIDGIETLY